MADLRIQNVKNWRNCIQDRKKWKDIVETAKTYKGCLYKKKKNLTSTV
jgi:hypothetical protein